MPLFNSFRQHLYRFFSKPDYEETIIIQKALNKNLLKLFHSYGIAKKLQSVEFFFYTNTLDKANNLAIQLSLAGYEIYSVSESTYENTYSIIGCTPPIKMDNESLTGWSEERCKPGYDNDCKFDGWGTLIE